MLEGGSDRAQREREVAGGQLGEMLREGEGYGGQLGPVPSGSDRPVSSPQTNANTDVRHVACAESNSAEGQYLESIMKGEQEATVVADAWSLRLSICAGSECRRRVVM